MWPRIDRRISARRPDTAIRGRRPAALLACATSLALGGCGLHDANNDLGGAVNLAVRGEHLIVARGDQGIEVVDATSGERLAHMDPAGGDSVDDVSVDGDRVLALDADDGVLSAFRLAPGGGLSLLSPGIDVEVGPYSGVSAGARRVVVSGGTCDLQVLAHAVDGSFGPATTVSGFRGRPDVTVLDDGSWAIVSMHFSGSEDEQFDGQEYGIATFDLSAPRYVDQMGLAGAGVTEGGGTPASWPVRTRVRARTAFVAHGGGLDVVHVGGDGALERRAHLDLPFEAVDVDVFGGRAWVVGGEDSRVATVDVSDEASPSVVETRGVPGGAARASAIRYAAGRLAIAVPDRGVVFVDP